MSTTSTRSQTGWSLVKGPVAIIGVLGIAFGVAGLIFGGHGFTTASIPHGTIIGKHWLGIELNGWTNLLSIAAGLLLLLGSTMHWGAKTASFIVAGVLGAAAVIALIRGNGIFGIFAANHRTEIVWGIAAVVLVVLSMLPRVGGKSRSEQQPIARDQNRVVEEAPAARRVRVVEDDRDGDALVTRDDRDADALVTRDDRSTGAERSTGDAPIADAP